MYARRRRHRTYERIERAREDERIPLNREARETLAWVLVNKVMQRRGRAAMTNRRRNRGGSRPRAGAADEATGFRADIAPEKPDEPRPLVKPIWLHPSVSDTLRE